MTSSNSIMFTHDQFVRKAMTDLRVARDFFSVYLPENLRENIDLNNLVLQPRSHISEVSKESIVDILYKTTLREEEAYLYVLLEHQSKPDKLMPFRMLKYTCNVIDDHLKKNSNAKIPLVYPIVLYHGSQDYPYSNHINDLVNAPREIVDNYFLKPFHLIDLNKIEDEELKKNAWSGVMAFTLKHIFEKDVLPYLSKIAEIMRNVDRLGGSDYISVVLQYILERGELKSKEDFYQLVEKEISFEVGEKVMTLGERLRYEGQQEGRQEGQFEEKVKTAKRLLEKGAEINFVIEITELSLAEVQEISTATI